MTGKRRGSRTTRRPVAGPAAAQELPDGDLLRANTYMLLGALLARAPTEEVTAALREIRRLPANESGSLAAAWETLRLAGERAVDPEALDDEFHALFIGLGRGEVVPYGSWYLTGLLMDRPLALLRRDLDALGFERKEGVGDPEDHAAALCETMGLIIRSEDISFESQRGFFEEHVAPWMGTFFRDLQQAGSARFYRAVGEFGEQFMEFEQQYLSMLA